MTSPLAERSVQAPMDPSRATWAAIIDRARRDLPEAAFNLWFADLSPGDLKGDVLELIVSSAYVKNWLAAHHMDLISSSAREILGPAAKVRLKLERPKRNQQTPADALGHHSPFPDRYTFDTFVPGASNKFAHAAALAVAEAPPSKAYNPVFVYGG